MNHAFERSVRVFHMVESALKMSAADVKKTEEGEWTLNLHRRKKTNGIVKLEKEWLVIKFPIQLRAGKVTEKNSAVSMKKLCQFSEWNSALSGLAKFAINGDRKSVQLQADVPVLKDDPLLFDHIFHAVEEVYDEFRKYSAKRKWCKKKSMRISSSSQPAGTLTEIAALCTDAGWKCNVSPGDTVVVPLDVPGSFYYAKIEKSSKQGFRISADMVSTEPWKKESMQAISLLLLKANASVRMARASLVRSNGAGHSVLFEVCLPNQPTGPEVKHALCALSVLVRFFGSEARVMGNTKIARAYLAMNNGL